MTAETSPNGKAYDYSSDGLYFKHLTTTTTSLVDAEYIEQLVIPEEADGRSVTEIANKAFENRIDIESVTFSSTLLKAPSSFKGCEYLTEVHFPENSTNRLTLNLTFENSAIASVVIPEYIKLESSFLNCSKLKEVRFLGNTNTSSGFISCTSLTTIHFADNMEYIGGFKGCTALESITIPSSVKTIYGDAFRGCTKLSTVIAENSNIETIQSYAFSGAAIKTLPKFEKLRSISTNAFEYTDIQEFEVPASLNSGDLSRVFYGCNRLEKLVYPNLETVIKFPYVGNKYDLYIKDTLLEELTVTPAMNTVQFSGCRSLKRLIFADSNIKKEYRYAFNDCENLEYVEIGAGVHNFMQTFYKCINLKEVKASAKNKTEKLGLSTFSGCSSLESVDFPNVSEIENYVFEDCSALRHVSLPKLTKVNSRSFTNCTSLESVELSNVTELGEYCFENCTSLKSISLPLANIPDIYKPSQFKGCTSLTTVNLPSLSVISNNMFYGCSALSNLTVGDNVEIGSSAFYECKALKEFDFSKVLKIGYGAFSKSGLTEAVLNPTTVITGNEFAFNNCPDLKKIVMWNESTYLNINNLPSLEYFEIKGNTPYFTMEQCMSQKPGALVFNGDVDWIASMVLCPKLETLDFRGKIGLMKSRSNWALFRDSYGIRKVIVSDLNNWLDCKFEGDGSAPGYDAPVGEVDFYVGNEKLTHLHVPAGRNVPDHSFTNFPIEEVTIEYDHFAGPVSIGNRAFHLCSKLKRLTINGTVNSIGAYAFAGSDLETFTVPETVTVLGDGIFSGCHELRSVTLSSGIKHLPNGFTYNCPKLEKLIIPEGVETLGYYITGAGCNLKYLSLPSTLKTVSMYLYYDTFQNLPMDTEVWSWASVPPDGGRAVFQGVTVHVPVNCGDAYRRMNIWRDAKIVDDIATGHKYDVNGTTITIELPANDYNALGKPDKYVVDIYEVSSGGEETLCKTLEFDAEGNLVSSRAAANTFVLNIPELAEETEYKYHVKAYTSSGDLITSHHGSAVTGKMSGTSNIADDKITVSSGVINLPESVMGKEISIFTTDGKLIIKHRVGNGETSYPLENLSRGLYIIHIDNKVIKVNI